jgi:hypothetical protein
MKVLTIAAVAIAVALAPMPAAHAKGGSHGRAHESSFVTKHGK